MSLYVLDTDIVSLFRQGHPAVVANCAAHPPTELAVTIITVEEQLSGWYTLLRRVKKRDELARAYLHLQEAVQFFGSVQILPFNEPAILRFEQLRAMNLNVGGSDLRIAAIALENGCVVVTRNTRDFQRVPGLTLEDWTV